MKFIDRLLAHVKQPSAPTVATPANLLNERVSRVIDDALASAGLKRGDIPSGGVAGVIDDALTRAGLRGDAPVSAPYGRQAPTPAPVDAPLPAGAAQGEFVAKSFSGPAGTLAYKLYLPAGYEATTARTYPLLVMLHGCTQSPDDFATGTRMNALADQYGVLVAYPAQSVNANGSKCWNWFRPLDQSRGSGEPALIAGMTEQLLADARVDRSRIYVAGLSAGAAMAVVLGRTYPELFAAVGAHSGLPYAAAHDVGSAFAAMKQGAQPGRRAPAADSHKRVPTIVFHGDRDGTVSLANGGLIVAQATNAEPGDPLAPSQQVGTAAGGRSYTRTDYRNAAGKVVVEDWLVHGGGHAWMGGDASGSYTDPQGPDASAEMLRFFRQHAL